MRYLFSILLIFGLSACEKSATNFESGLEQQILYIANGNEPRELDPQLATGSPESNLLLSLSEGLVNRDPETLAIIPGVAESWEISDDRLTYTFNIRKNARWSNGETLTAHDFVWSWQRSLMSGLGSQWAYMKYYIKNAEAYFNDEIDDVTQLGIRAEDDHTLVVTLNAPTDFFLQLTYHNSYYPVHKDTVLKHGEIDQPISRWPRPENWVGNGPFVLKEWEVNKLIAVTKNPEYWDADNVKLNGIVFYPMEDPQAEVRAYRSGQVHLTYTPDLAIEKVQQYRQNEPESLRVTSTYSSYYYAFNTTRDYFKDKRVRKALALAIDRKTLTERVTKAGESPSYSLVPPDPNGYSPSPLFEYNLEKARALLAEAGYPGGEGFPTVELLYNTQEKHRLVALTVQQMLKENLGINIQPLNQEWKVYLNTRKSLAHDIARAGWIADYLEPSNFFELMLSDSGNNHTGWKNEEYDDIIKKLKQTSDPEARYALFDRANEILSEEMPVIPLYLYSDVNLVSPVVKGWYDNVMHEHPYNRVYLEAAN